MPLTERKKYICTNDNPFYLVPHIGNRVWLAATHAIGFYGLFLIIFGQVPRTVFIFCFLYARFAATGMTVGAHRLWSHKSFKAKLPLKILLAFMQTASMQLTIFKWARDHRIHHKYSETFADPHDARRGFWFSHIGWLVLPERDEVKEKEATIDYSDLDNDPVVRFQAKYFFFIAPIAAFIVPVTIMHLIWPQLTFWQLTTLDHVWYLLNLHITLLLNSWAHLKGSRPYDKHMYARENTLFSFIAHGEGWLNYHHTFPWDYKTAELGYYKYNWSTIIIDFFAWIGWAYDLKTVPFEVVRDRVIRTGDGSHPLAKLQNGSDRQNELKINSTYTSCSWGWGDQDIPQEQILITETRNPSKVSQYFKG